MFNSIKKVIPAKISPPLLFLLFILPVIISCGGGGGGGGGAVSEESITYSGPTSMAIIDENNASDLSIDAYGGGTLAQAPPSPYGTQRIDDAISLRQKNNSGSIHLLGAIGELIRTIPEVSINTTENGYSISEIHEESGNTPGNCGGNITWNISINDITYNVTGTNTYNNYCEDGVIFSGAVNLSGTISGNSFTHAKMTFRNFTFSDDTSSFSLNGSFDFNFSLYRAYIITINIDFKDNNRGRTYRLKDYILTMTDRGSYFEFEISGKFYHPDHGYIIISTHTPFCMNSTDSAPYEGRIVITGRNGNTGGNTKASLSCSDADTYVLQADTNGDGTYDWSPGPRHWSEDSPTPNPAPTPDPPPASDNISNLGFRVIDAEYSHRLDKIIMVSSDPLNQLHIYDPVSEQDTTVDLNLAPTSVSVSPDGLFAAVGHNAWVSYVNLSTGVLIEIIPVSTDVIDIVLAGNGYIYAFPRRDQWERIRCINIDTETETSHSGSSIRAGTLAKLQPNGSAIYGANNGVSPSDIEKYDISGGTAQRLYDSPYHGDYYMCGNLWISEDGLRIFTGCGNVFRTSDVRANDMTYNGSLSQLTRITGLSHSSEARKVIAIPQTDTKLQLYDDTFLTYESTATLPEFIVGQNSYAGHGRFVFFSSDGSEFFVIMQADGSSGMQYDYGVAAYNTPQDPPAPPPESGTGVNFNVVDAEYSDQLDKIIMVSSNPSNQLHIYDPNTEHYTSVNLNLAPTSVSVSPDGLFAAVGHNAWVSYINLNSGTLEKVMPVSIDVIDIVLAGNGYIYAFPSRAQSQSEHISSLDIASEVETLPFHVYGGTLAKLHPDGSAIYAANNGVSPSDIEKFDITGGTAQRLYDSPYHGDYSMCGNLWMSEDGLRIFTRCRNVFRASDIRADDMTYNGSLSQLTRITHLNHSTEAGKIAAISQIDTELKTYDYDFLTYESTITLPRFFVGQNSYAGHGRFVFFNSNGTKFFVIIQADETSGLLYDYDVVAYNTNGEPIQTVFNADFESDTPGASPSLDPAGDPAGDYITMTDIGSVTVVGSDSIFPSNSIDIESTSTLGPRAVYLYAYPAPASGPYTTSGTYDISWSSALLTPSDSGGPLIGLKHSYGGFTFAVIYWYDGTIKVTNVSSFQDTGATYNLGVSQDFRVIVDYNTDTFDLFIDDTLYGDDLPLRRPDAAELRSFGMTVGYPAKIRIDDIILNKQ